MKDLSKTRKNLISACPHGINRCLSDRPGFPVILKSILQRREVAVEIVNNSGSFLAIVNFIHFQKYVLFQLLKKLILLQKQGSAKLIIALLNSSSPKEYPLFLQVPNVPLYRDRDPDSLSYQRDFGRVFRFLYR